MSHLSKLGVAAALLGLAACATPKGVVSLGPSEARRPGFKSVLVLMPESSAAEATRAGLEQELKDQFDLFAKIVRRDSTTKEIDAAVREVRPAVVVLMNNTTVRLYGAYQKTASAEDRAIPAVALLTSFLRETAAGMENVSGVIYEVPLVTSLVNLRALLKQPVKKVGVLHRPAFKSYILEQQSLLGPEGFELLGVELAGTGPTEITDGLARLRNEHVDAIWVLNDDALLERRLLQAGWLPALRDNKLPVVVNVASLISKRVSFGTFGILPDHRALGTQAGSIIEALAQHEFATPASFEYPLSVETMLDVTFAKKNLELEEQQLAKVDKLVQ